VQWLALGGAVLVMMGLTFALGLLVGRQWARQSASAVVATVAEPARKPAAPSRRGGIAAETAAERAPEPTLTFYHTLTEPLDGAGAPPKGEPKAVSVRIPPAIPPTPRATAPAVPPPAPAPRAPAVAPSLPPPAGKAAASKPVDGRTAEARPPEGGSAVAASVPAQPKPAPAGPSWTVQVGAYKNRRQADEARQHLSGTGLDAYVVTLAAQEGVARYRVRVGTYRTRDEAVAASERLRAQRSLSTFVTPR
jgi:cell division septation protein DedD